MRVTYLRLIMFLFGCAIYVVSSEQAVAQIGLGSARGFTSQFLSRKSTVSPYVQLGFANSRSVRNPAQGLAIYQNQVRPQLQARQRQRERDLRIQSVQTNVNQISRGMQRSSATPGTTGHPTRFMAFLHYFNMPGR